MGIEKWLIEELENKARMEQFDNERKAHLTVKSSSDFDVPDPAEIRMLHIDQYDGKIDAGVGKAISKFENLYSISFSSRYQEKICPEIVNEWLHTLPSVRALSFRTGMENSITWPLLAAIDLSSIEKLSVSMLSREQPIPLSAPVLEEFTLFGPYDEELSRIEKCCLERIWYDFSGMPALKKLTLNRCGFWDYESLSCLHRLEHLIVTDRNLLNLSWLSPNYSLATLNVFACVEDLSGIETQPCLEMVCLGYNKLSEITELGKLLRLRHLDLRGNNISDASPLKNLELLEYLNMRRNPLDSEGGLRTKGIKTLLLNSQDGSIEAIDRIVGGFSQQVHWWIRNEDSRDISQLPEWHRNTILKNRQKPYEERLMDKFQSAFEQEFQRINPFELSVDELRVNLREEYIRRASGKYPFLKGLGRL